MSASNRTGCLYLIFLVDTGAVLSDMLFTSLRSISIHFRSFL